MTRPLWLFVIGPIVLGIPHLMSDARYLILRQRVSREVTLRAALTASAMFVGLRVLDLFPRRAGTLGKPRDRRIAIAWIMIAIVERRA